MCGIVGAVVEEGRHADLVREMTPLITHRGPDEDGFYSHTGVSLGFRRLSIIDPNAGHQPVFGEDEAVVAFCNGEIYNHADHRGSLERTGHRLRSGSDAEVIPHLYEQLGRSFVCHLHGMFAISLYDREKRELVLARDPIGIKPLYYMQTSEGFYFASEMKCFLVVPEYSPEVDRVALDRLLTFRHIPGENRLLSGVRSLPPGHLLIYDLDSRVASTERYYGIPERTSQSPVSMNGAAIEVLKLFDEAVRARLMSDVPLGVALSGGLDSSAVAASVAIQSGPPMTFAVNTGETSDDVECARLVAERYKTDHHELHMATEDLHSVVPTAMWHVEEPFGIAEVPSYYLGMAAAKYVKVLLSGDGADELFGGYSRFQPINMVPFLPKSILKWGYVRGVNGLTKRERRRLYAPTQRSSLGPDSNLRLDAALDQSGGSILDRVLRYELEVQLPQYQLTRLDKMTMAHSVETRVPFLDTNLVAYVANLSSRLKVRGIREKLLLKHAMVDRLPARVIERRKFGLTAPARRLLRGDSGDFYRRELDAGRSTLEHYFSSSAIDRIFSSVGRKFLSLPEQKLFQLYLFLKWHQIFIDGEWPIEARSTTANLGTSKKFRPVGGAPS